MFEFPKCQRCAKGVLVPLSDYGVEGASLAFKAWACTSCKFVIRVDKGFVSYDEIGKKKDDWR